MPTIKYKFAIGQKIRWDDGVAEIIGVRPEVYRNGGNCNRYILLLPDGTEANVKESRLTPATPQRDYEGEAMRNES